MVSFVLNFVKFMWRLNLLQSCIFSSTIIVGNLDDLSNILSLDASFISGKLHIRTIDQPNIDVVECLKEKINSRITVKIALYLKFDSGYQFQNDNFAISVRLSERLSRLIFKRKIKSSEYINEILKFLSITENLDTLDLSSLYLTEIPQVIFECDKLRELILNNNELENFEIISNCLPNLRELLINNNKKLTNISESILNLPSLQFLYANNCSITEMPESIDKLKKVYILCLSNNPISALPKSVSNIEKLKFLNFSNCSLGEVTINMLVPTELNYVNLENNFSLKCLRILIPETSQKLISFNISDCPLVNVEVHVTLKNTKFSTFKFEKEEFDYVIKFNPNKLINNRRNPSVSEFKFFEYYFDFRNCGLNGTILVREFNPEIKNNLISQNNLIDKWIRIYEKYNFHHKNTFENEFNYSIAVLNNLYKIQCDNCLGRKVPPPFECKERMILILSELFDQLEENYLETQVIDILQIFDKPYLERLVYLNYLVKLNKSNSSEKIHFLDFIKDTIETMRDFTFAVCLNKAECELEIHYKQDSLSPGESREHFGNSFTFLGISKLPMFRERQADDILKNLLKVIVNAKKRFDFKFTVDYIASMIYNTIKRVRNNELLNSEMVQFLLYSIEPTFEYFEYETHSDVTVISKVSIKGMKILINLILNGNALISQDN